VFDILYIQDKKAFLKREGFLILFIQKRKK
jgi:hypothetical protein